MIKTQVKYVDIRNKTIYTMINLTNHISSDYRDCQTTHRNVFAPFHRNILEEEDRVGREKEKIELGERKRK